MIELVRLLKAAGSAVLFEIGLSVAVGEMGFERQRQTIYSSKDGSRPLHLAVGHDAIATRAFQKVS